MRGEEAGPGLGLIQMLVLIDGEPFEPDDATISVFDWGVIRGFGVFEVVRSYGGVPFRLDAHLDRLARSAAGLWIELPPRDDLGDWIRQCAVDGGDCQVRLVVTGGGREPAVSAPSRAIAMAEPVPAVPDTLSILPLRAPWHPATDEGGFPGIKWISYAPNMAATDTARRSGFDDALLLTSDDTVLEGPTYTVAWAVDGRIETPSLELGILRSITRDVLMESAGRLGLAVSESAFPLERLLSADEAFGLSTVKEVTPIGRVGDVEMTVGEVGRSLAAEFAAIVSGEIGAPPGGP
jgi:branched-subunit amino acid aminotransferase/4-amino-4-deoxychorismate lyase